MQTGSLLKRHNIRKLDEIGIAPILGVKVVEVLARAGSGIKLKMGDGSIEEKAFDGSFHRHRHGSDHRCPEEAGIIIDDNGYIMTNESRRRTSPRLRCGDCTGKSHQVVVAVGQGAVAATTPRIMSDEDKEMKVRLQT
jgi:thioredoxin reductase